MIKRNLFAPSNRWGPVKRTGQSISGGTNKPPSSGGIKKGGSKVSRNDKIINKARKNGTGNLRERLIKAAVEVAKEKLKDQFIKHATKQIQKVVQKSPQKTEEPAKAEDP